MHARAIAMIRLDWGVNHWCESGSGRSVQAALCGPTALLSSDPFAIEQIEHVVAQPAKAMPAVRSAFTASASGSDAATGVRRNGPVSEKCARVAGKEGAGVE